MWFYVHFWLLFPKGETTTEAKLETSTTQAVTAEPETTSTQPNTAAMMATQPSNIATSMLFTAHIHTHSNRGPVEEDCGLALAI